MSLSLPLELIGLILYAVIIIVVLLFAFIKATAENRRVLTIIIFLIALIGFNFFISIPIIQFFLFFLVILDLFYLVYVHILPFFYTRSDRLLFTEISSEVWEDLKVHETIQEKKETG
jgi:hypothetical protein